MTPDAFIEVVDRIRAPEEVVELIGVDPVRHVVVLRHEDRRLRPYTVVAIDWTNGDTVEKWSASGIHQVDMQHLAETLGQASFAMRDEVPPTRPVPGAASKALYREDNTLLVADERGVLHELFKESNLDRKEHLSPKGDFAAWVRFAGTNPRFSLIVAPLRYDPEHAMAADVQGYSLAGPLWAPDARAVYMTAHDEDSSCLYRADIAEFLEVWTLQCAVSQGMSLAMDPSGQTAALIVHHTFTSADVLWVDLPSGQVRARVDDVTIDGAHTADVLFSSSGLLVGLDADSRSISVVDLASARKGRIDAGDASFMGIGASEWIDDGKLIALRKAGDAFEVVQVDARAALR